ncbi:pyridoxamine 5'-phosphate oxidase family protein [Thalassospira alkalitolerans]|uniref:pyridoxamine 5'-phosphate oxidase family protein n=1 Tax=Thalassospira alkalitolerans TaxID=1293890 RepID=UPI003AA7B281
MTKTKLPARPEQLSHYPDTSPRSLAKELTALDPHCTKFIALAPFCVLASADTDASPDLSPRGGAPGFATVIDANTILLPDRPGNNRLDNLGNLARNPKIALIFMIPGVNETLRIKGRVSLVTDPAELARFAEQGTAPRSMLRITIDRVFLHCAKALMRSKLWHPDAIVDRSVLPTMGKMIKDQTNAPEPAETQDAMEKRYRNTL